ncbi:MAG: ribonuclease H [Prevotella sp.]|jgi:hypothetical protein|nr:ribonuclease H [Prevotella sp.]
MKEYKIWIGGSCDYGHKERAGAAACIIEYEGQTLRKDVVSDLHTTKFRMMLTLMVKTMAELPKDSELIFLTNAAYIQNFDTPPTSKSANPDLILQCIEEKKRHHSVSVKIVPYHKNPLLIETHERSTEAMKVLRTEFHAQQKERSKI